MKRLLAIFLTLAATLRADPPTGYYDSATGLSGDPLKTALHDIVDGHNVLLYDELFGPIKTLWQDPNNASNMTLIYNGTSISKSATTWNREHLWPRSRGNSDQLGPDDSDLHYVVPCDADVNLSRSNLYFDESSAADGGLTDPAHAEAPLCSKDSNSWEPRPADKGDIARALFYCAVRYDGTEPNTNDMELVGTAPAGPQMANLDTLIAWHNADPPDAAEIRRNDLIFSNYQGNRNPFIDHPEWVTAIWGTGTGGLPVAQATASASAASETPLSPATVILRLSPAAPTGGVAVQFAVGGTSSSGDFTVSGSGVTYNSTARTGTATFAAGASSITLSISPVADGLIEPAETAHVTVAPGTGYIATGSGIVTTITDTTPPAAPGYIATWNFDVGVPFANPILPNTGNGGISTSGWTGTINSFAGITLQSFALVGSSGNNSHIQLNFPAAGWTNLSVNFFTRRSATGHITGTWSWSTDGTTFTPIAGINTAATTDSSTFEAKTLDLTAITALNNAPSVTLRYTLSGATSGSGSTRIEDLAILGTHYSSAWLARFPTLNGTNADHAADPDGDGINNFTEWAFDLDPFTPEPPQLATPVVVQATDPADGLMKNWPAFTFTRRNESPHLTYAVQHATALGTWLTNAVFVSAATGPTAASERATFRAPAPLGAPQFFRVHVTE